MPFIRDGAVVVVVVVDDDSVLPLRRKMRTLLVASPSAIQSNPILFMGCDCLSILAGTGGEQLTSWNHPPSVDLCLFRQTRLTYTDTLFHW